MSSNKRPDDTHDSCYKQFVLKLHKDVVGLPLVWQPGSQCFHRQNTQFVSSQKLD